MPAVSENRRMNRRGQITSYSTSGAGASAQCHLVFPKLLSLHSWWGGPPGPQPTPTSACWVWMNLISLARSGSRGTRADQGVCPTTASGCPVLGKLSGIGRKRLPHLIDSAHDRYGRGVYRVAFVLGCLDGLGPQRVLVGVLRRFGKRTFDHFFADLQADVPLVLVRIPIYCRLGCLRHGRHPL